MYIDVRTLVKVATPRLAQVKACRAAQRDYTDLAYELLGMLETFVDGYDEAEEKPTD